MITSKVFDVNANVNGAEALLNGIGIVVSGNPPSSLSVAIDSQDGPRVPLGQFRVWHASKPFKRLFLFYSVDPLILATDQQTFTISTFSSDMVPAFPIIKPLASSGSSVDHVIFTLNTTANGTTAIGGSNAPAGQRRRLSAYRIDVRADSYGPTAAQNVTIQIIEQPSNFVLAQFTVYIGSAAPANPGPPWSSGWVVLPKPYATVDANNLAVVVSGINAPGSLTAGNIAVTAAHTLQ